MDWILVVAVIATGLFAGFINTVAGGGSLLSLPLLMFLGLPPTVANGTNRVAIFLQNVVGVSTFHKQKVLNLKADSRLAVPAIIGSVFGAMLAVDIDEALFQKIVGGVLIVMFFLIVFKPEVWVKQQAGKTVTKPTVVQYIIFFLIGAYGGFIQAGVGFFLLAGLVLGAGYDLVKANAVKVLIVLFYTSIALVVFFINKQIDLGLGLTLALGNMVGAWLGARFAVRKGPQYVRYFLLIALVAAALKLFGVF